MARILIADDHDVVRSGIRRILEDQPGRSVVAEANQPRGRHAEAVATKPDVAIHEYALPVLNGIQATRQIRQRVPSVEVTMHATEDLLRESINAGARLRAEIRRPAAFDFCHPVAGSHKPFFTDRAPQVLLENLLSKKNWIKQALTGREQTIVQMVAAGHSNKQIANLLDISLKRCCPFVGTSTPCWSWFNSMRPCSGAYCEPANHVRGCNGLCSTEKLSRSYPGRENQGKDQDETLDDEGVVQYDRAR